MHYCILMVVLLPLSKKQLKKLIKFLLKLFG